MPTLVRSYGLDALDSIHGGNGFAKPDPEAFLRAIAGAPGEEFPAVGLGTDLRVTGHGIVGGCLVVDTRVVHMVAFPAGDADRPAPRRKTRLVY